MNSCTLSRPGWSSAGRCTVGRWPGPVRLDGPASRPGKARPLVPPPPDRSTRNRGDTRQRLLDEALDATEGEAFTSLSLRALTRRVGIVPTGFYRHFADMDELGLALVEETFDTLQAMIRSVREDPIPPEDMIRGSVAVLADHVQQRPSHFRFIAREMHGGSRALRDAIHDRLGQFTDELVADLARLPVIADWPEPDQRMFAQLIVTLMVATAADLVEHPEERVAITHRAEQQLRLAVLAVPRWRP